MERLVLWTLFWATAVNRKKYLPVVLTVFLFVLCSNWLGLVPGVGSFIVHTGDGASSSFSLAGGRS